MSRAPLVFSAVAIFCASSFLALADERSAISSAVARSETVAMQTSAAKKQEHEYRHVFKDAGVEVTLASPKGGRPPLDPKSNEPNFQTDTTRRFKKDAAAEAQLDRTVRLDSVKQEDYDTVFYPGGHGPMWDLAEDPNSVKLIESFLAAGKTIALVCHAPGVLRHVKTPAGEPLVDGRNVTGFTDGEEADVGLTKIVPFLVEDELLGLGAIFSKVKNWGVYTITDGQLITGQNPASSGPAAKLLIDTLNKKAK
jgi:putative intracellular protease/amidase